MSFTTRGSLDRKGIPAGYRETLYWRLGEKRWRVITVNLVALLSLAFWLLLFRWLGINVGRIPHSAFIFPPWVLVLAGILLTLVVHELTHALAMIAFGAARSSGLLTQGMLYATARPRSHRPSGHRPGRWWHQSAGVDWHHLAGRHAVG
jgi:hypothetical protein